MDNKRNLLQNLGELEVYLLLQNAKLLQYFDAFINHGGDDIQQLIDSLKDPNEFDQLIKIVGMDNKPLHVQRLKKALIQYSLQNNTPLNHQYITKEFQSNSNNNNIYTTQEGSSLNITDNNNSSMFTNANWCSFLPSIYSGLNLIPNQSSLMNSLPSTQCILSNYSQQLNPLFNQWAILNNPQNYSMFQSLAMGISDQRHLMTPAKCMDRRLSNYTHSLEQTISSQNSQQQEENIQDINETSQSKTQNNLLNSPTLSRNNSPYSLQLSQPPILHPSPFISSNEEINLTETITNSQIHVPKLILTENFTEDPLKVRPSATLMKSDYLKLEIAITALLPYLPKFQIRKSNNSRNTNEQEIQEILKLPENDKNRINGLRKHSLIFGRTDSVKRLTRPLRHFEITINEITFRLVQQIPELITQREHLFHIARQIVNTMNYGLSVNQTGQVCCVDFEFSG
ncbi:hypothetical protein Smp_041960 [Schistosoma mansoni]|uniref:hypothetical protein n=1 Tax=Schistosoma mansoni TaxID=6183 RepID=UPI0001A63EDC|nr:hypothetical protein Smp_041960 [Schistosoma mansoni]|eukprot:XP_018652273.1 hypothetical protein Smp_041960 [Schistosoma mansoni]